MVTQDTLRKYAELAVRVGVNVQPGQLMVLASPVDCAFFARLCVEEAYRAGAGEVRVNWTDEYTDKLRYEYEEQSSMASIAPWRIQQKQDDIDRRCCFLHIKSSTPGLLAGIPGEKLQAVRVAEELAFEKLWLCRPSHGPKKCFRNWRNRRHCTRFGPPSSLGCGLAETATPSRNGRRTLPV